MVNLTRSILVSLLLPIAAAWTLAMPLSCTRSSPPADIAPARPAFDLADTVDRLSGLALDEAFYDALDELEAVAASPSATAQVKEALVKYKLRALAAALSSGEPEVERLLGSKPGGKALGRYIEAVASTARSTGDADSAAAMEQLAKSAEKSEDADLGRAILAAAGDSPNAPVFRLLLCRLLVQALDTAASAPEWRRGEAILDALPGLPKPSNPNLVDKVFPTAMGLLSQLLKQGPGTEKALAGYYERTRKAADAALGDRVFPVVYPEPSDKRPGTPPSGIAGGYVPLRVLVVEREQARFATRPALSWKDGHVRDLAADPGRPGKVFGKLGKDHEPDIEAQAELLEKLIEDSRERIAVAEKGAYADFLPHEGDTVVVPEPPAVLLALHDDSNSGWVSKVLRMARLAGIRDFRLVRDGGDGRVLPVFAVAAPKAAGAAGVIPIPAARLIVALAPDKASVYGPAKRKSRLPATGWPDGAKVVKSGKDVFKIVVPWTREKGFEGRLAAVVGLARKAVGASWAVDLAAGAKVPGIELVDAAAEIEAASGDPISDLDKYFVGIDCKGGCPAAVPIILSGRRIPRPAKAKTLMKESRPLGFCDKNDVARVMRGRSGAYRACYEIQLQRHPELGGRLQLKFTIEPDGTVSGIRVLRNDLNDKVASCIKKQVAGLRFPKPAGGVCVVRWPFKFKPGG